MMIQDLGKISLGRANLTSRFSLADSEISNTTIGLRGDSRLGNPKVMQAYQIWLLKKDYVAFWVEKPIDRIETSEIRFDLDKMVREAEPVEIQPRGRQRYGFTTPRTASQECGITVPA